LLASFQREKDVAISLSPYLRAINVKYPVNFALLYCVPHDWNFAGSFVLGSQRDTGVCPVAYLFDRLAVVYNRLMRLLIFTGVPQNECRFSGCS